jgi:hypothetical protein
MMVTMLQKNNHQKEDMQDRESPGSESEPDGNLPGKGQNE